MRTTTILFLLLLLVSPSPADNLEKSQKKALEKEVKAITAEAKSLVKAGQLAEARIKYAESQALIETKDVTEAIKQLDEDIRKRVKDRLSESRKLYESHKFKEAAATLDESMKLQAFQPVLAYNLALCYYHLGDRAKALEYAKKAKAGTPDPKQRQKLLQLITFFTTAESVSAADDRDKGRVEKVNRLSESIGLEASLEDAFGDEDSDADDDPLTDPPSPAPAAALKSSPPGSAHANINATPRSSLCNGLGDLKGALINRPSGAFDLANCAESNARAAEAVKMLEKYLELSPICSAAH